MLTTLSIVKTRLGLAETQIGNDALLAMLIAGVSARLERECRRVLKRTVDFAQEFPAGDLAVNLCCYPAESISRVEIKRSDYEGWQPRENLTWLTRSQCVVLFSEPPGSPTEMARIIYTGGYILPGAEIPPGTAPLPDDLVNAATDQVAYLFQNRDRLGVIRQWPKGGTYEAFAELDLLPSVQAALRHHVRW